jgi:thiol:disulfide interchange protein DsbD
MGLSRFAVSERPKHEPDPVSWSLDTSGIRLRLHTGEKFGVHLIATINGGWHIYSISQPPGGPIATVISLRSGLPFTLSDAIEGPEPEKAFDSNFQMKTEFYREAATFMLPLVVAADSLEGRQKLEVAVRFQACNETACLPPKTVKLEKEIEVVGNVPNRSAAVAEGSTAVAEPALRSDAMSSITKNAAYDFLFSDFSDKPHKLSEFKGKYVLLDFWATWCMPCLADIPKLKALYEKYKLNGFEIIGMDSETIGDEADAPDPAFAKETAERAKQIVMTRGVTWTQATSKTAVPVAMKIFGVKSLPTKILIDREGRIVATIGEKDDLVATVEKYLNANKDASK